MEKAFFSVLNMSLTASYVIIFVMLIRLPLKKAPKVISYALWGVVAFRLICPFSFESMFSLLPASTTPIPQNIAYQQSPQINSGIPFVDTYVNSSLPSPSEAASVNPLQIYAQIGAAIWILGLAAMLVYSIVSVLILKRRLQHARYAERNIYEADNLKTPFVLGIFKPRIYIPAGLTAAEKSFIIRHEQTHIGRYDHIVKPFAFLVLSIHWFNPLVWFAFVLMSTDMELSCDEKVIKEMGIEIKKAYSASLLSLASEKRILNGSPLAFGESNVRERIKNVLNYKKPSFWIVAASVGIVVTAGIGLLVNPVEHEQDLSFLNPNNVLSIMSEQQRIKITSVPYGDTYLSGAELAKWLDSAENDWSKRLISLSEESEATITIRIDDASNHQIRFFASEPTLALVEYGTERRYYRIPQEDYRAMEEAALLGTPHVQNMVLTEHEGGKEAAPVAISDADAIMRMSALILQGDKDKYAQLVSDTPSASDYIRIDFKSDAADQVQTYFVYSLDEKNSFIEKPYSHINKINMNTLQAIVAICTDAGGGQGLTAYASQQTWLEPIAPGWSIEQSIGADMAFLDYASDDIVIFHGYFGLFVYDLDSRRIIRSLDLKPLKCDATQGDAYCEVSVSTDGNTVQLHPMSSETMYVFTVSDNTLRETAYQPMENPFGGLVPITEVMNSSKAGIYSNNAVKFDTGEYGYLYAVDWTLGTLSYVRDDMMHRLFAIKEN